MPGRRTSIYTRPKANPRSSRLSSFLRRSPHHAEADILRPGRAGGTGVGGTIGTSADYLAFAVAGQHPLGDVAAEIVNWFFVVFALAMKTADFFQKWRWPRKFFRSFAKLRRIFRIRRIAGPEVESVLAIAVFIEAFDFIFVRQPPRLARFFAKLGCIRLSIGEGDAVLRLVGRVQGDERVDNLIPYQFSVCIFLG